MNDDMSDQLINDQAGLFRPGWIVKSLVYGVGRRTASGVGGSGQVPFLLAERARSECARLTRVFEDRPGHLQMKIGDCEDTRSEGRFAWSL
mgnify:FL=1